MQTAILYECTFFFSYNRRKKKIIIRLFHMEHKNLYINILPLIYIQMRAEPGGTSPAPSAPKIFPGTLVPGAAHLHP